MPFPDELHLVQVEVVAYRPEWVSEAAEVSARLRLAVPMALAVEHIGSTSVSGMWAKDCLDLMVVVNDLATTDAEQRLVDLGFRRRPEPWNNDEPADGRLWPKMVFAPPVGGRRVNVHVRAVDSGPTRVALLFRDFLRSSAEHTETWSSLKRAAAAASGDLAVYGGIKAPAWLLLMELAERWAADEGWVPRVTPASGS